MLVVAFRTFFVTKFRSAYTNDIVVLEKMFLHSPGINKNAVLASPVDNASDVAFNNNTLERIL